MMEEPVSLPLKMQMMIVVTTQSWNQKNVDLLWGTDWKVKHFSTKDYWTKICWGIPTMVSMVSTISKDSCDPICIKGARNVLSYRFMQFMKYNRGIIYKNGWLDFDWLETDLLSLGWIYYQVCGPPVQKQLHSLYNVAKNMKNVKLNSHKLQQQYQDKNHMSVYHGQMNMHWQHSDNSMKTEEHNREAIPLGDSLLALIFVSLADLTQDQGTHSQVSWHTVEEH